MEIVWLGHASFKIKTDNGKLIFLDPFQIKQEDEKADIIVSSHAHSDHFSNSDIKKIIKDSTVLIGPNSILKNLKRFNGRGLDFGESLTIDDVTITLVPAYTINKSTHPKENKWAGIIIETEGKRVYHAGDTERIQEMKELAERKITVALLPCGGSYTMDFEESCNSALDIKPEIVIPMHNWNKNLNDFKTLMLQKDPNIRVEILENRILKI